MKSVPFAVLTVHHDGRWGSPFSSCKCDGMGAPEGQRLGHRVASWGSEQTEQRAQTAEARGRGSWGRKEGKKGAAQRSADPGVCVRKQTAGPLCTRGGCARYLHDRLGEVPGTPVTEAGLRRGRDETSVSSSVICIVGGLQGRFGKGGEKIERIV